jgi:hypothetical protein
VGSRGQESTGTVTTGAEHWDGNSWTLFSTSNVASKGQNALLGADALTGTDVWSVGYSTPGDAESSDTYKTLVKHWDGTQ